MEGARAIRDPVRCVVCGSVDDGKSTLIGRLLAECRQVPADQLVAAADVSLLLDGLEAEREQGITIDVAHRPFETASRRFILADAPGHVHYTRNMVTAASTADLAIILIDARFGLVAQTRRHLILLSLLGVREAILAVNKMDLVGHSKETFDTIAVDFAALAQARGVWVEAVPVCAISGDNITERSAAMPWYQGPTLLGLLDQAAAGSSGNGGTSLRMPVQLVARDGAGARWLSGTIAMGSIATGTSIQVAPSGAAATVDRLLVAGRDAAGATAGDAVALTLSEPVDCARGDVIADAAHPPEAADQFEATLAWLDEQPLLPGRSYTLQLATASATATVTALKHAIDIDSGAPAPARSLAMNDIGVVTLALDRRIAFEPYAVSRDLGGFILIDRETNATAGAGTLHFALRRADNLSWQNLTIDRAERASQKGQQPRVVWLTGRPGAGKSTIADAVERLLNAQRRHTFLLDGDNLRHGLNRDLGFTPADRVENIRRAGEVARLMWEAGLIVLAAFISPYRSDRRTVRELFPDGAFVEVYVDATLEQAIRRDPKGLYAKARRGEITNLTGVDSPYEPPENPDLHIDTGAESAQQAAERIVRYLAP